MDDLRDVDCFLVAGSDPAENYPVMFNRIIEGKKKGAKIISVDIAQTSTTESSDDHLKIRTEMLIPFVSYLISKFVDSDKISRDAKQFHGFQDLVESAQEVSRKYPPSSYGLDKEKMTQVFQTLRDARKIGICFGMGVTQHSNGTENVKALVQLGILLNGVIFPSRGKMNVQGAGDAGGCPNWEGTDNLESFKWNIDYKNHEGRGLTDALYDRDVKFVWIAGGDPAISMPDLNLLEESFRHKFIVYQGAHSARVTKWASVVLPSAMVSEENGTFTNGERRVRGNFSNTLSKSLPDKAKSGFQIMMEFADTVGAEGFDYKNEQEVFEEIVETVPGYRGLSLEKVTSDEGQFADKSIKYTRLEKINFDMDHFRGDGVYPFTLTTSRGKFHFCTGNLSRNSKSLNQLSGEPVVYMNPLDMDFLGIEDEQKIKIISEVGEITATVEKNIDVMKRMIVAQFHFPKMLVNKLTPRVLDPHSGTPSYKQVPVKIEVLI
jgi:predicted molibdopterin-dependent oxidoreductase YjgC